MYLSKGEVNNNKIKYVDNSARVWQQPMWAVVICAINIWNIKTNDDRKKLIVLTVALDLISIDPYKQVQSFVKKIFQEIQCLEYF